MKNYRLLWLVILIGIVSFASSSKEIEKDMTEIKVPTNRPKTPEGNYVTMYVYTSQGTLAFDFSDSIESLYVILTDEAGGTVQTGTVSQAKPSMDVFLPDNGTFWA